MIAQPPPRPAQFLRVDARTHTATVTLIASYDGENNGFNFDGYSRELMWIVPRNWKIRVVCENRGPLRNSCAVVHGPDAATPAFPHATTSQPTIGIEAGHEESFTFRASRLGVFRFASLVPGHEDARQWDVLKVVRGGRPSITRLQRS